MNTLSDLIDIENHPDTNLTIEELDDFLEYTSCDFEIQESLSKYKQEHKNKERYPI